MEVTKLSPTECIECGSPMKVGTATPVIFGFPDGENGEMVLCPIPALYRCAGCVELMRDGRLLSNIDPAIAFRYITESYLPRMRALWTVALAEGALRPRIEADVTRAEESAVTLASRLIYSGPLPLEPGVFAIGQDDSGECGCEIDPERILASIEMDAYGNITFLCPHCDQLHDAMELFESAELFRGIRSDSNN